uniref:Uncharacterized protein n=1 Tax=Oryza sativa subsp. japonica TaxID=39947 RepID=Q69XN4_ORYSJ|nr:hypothetical protein [Oryza sativa Japonica Group]BAD35443.1 hypothetical protein [Oryza sativa Japonica Group]
MSGDALRAACVHRCTHRPREPSPPPSMPPPIALRHSAGRFGQIRLGPGQIRRRQLWIRRRFAQRARRHHSPPPVFTASPAPRGDATAGEGPAATLLAHRQAFRRRLVGEGGRH